MFDRVITYRQVKLDDYNQLRPPSPRYAEQGVELKWCEHTFSSTITKEVSREGWFRTLERFRRFALYSMQNAPTPVPDPVIYGIRIFPEFDGSNIVSDETTWEKLLKSDVSYHITVGVMDSASLPAQYREEESMVGTKRLRESMDLQIETISHLHDRVKTLENRCV